MKEIDSLFKEKLESQGLEYSEASWKEMESLLDSNTPKRAWWTKKKSALLLLLLFAAGGSTVYFYQTKQRASVEKNLVLGDNKNTSDYNEPSTAFRHSNTVQIIQDTNHRGKQSSIVLNGATVGQVDRTKNNTFSVQIVEPGIVEKAHENEPIDIKEIGYVANSSELLQEQHQLGLRPLSPLPVATLSADSLAYKCLEIKHRKYRKWAWFVGAYGGLNFHENTVTSDVDFQKNKEKILNSASYGIQAIAKKNHLAVSFGLGVQDFSFRTNYSSLQNEYEYDTSLRLVKRNYRDNGRGGYIALVDHEVDSTITGSREEVICENCLARFNYLSIPISAQYEFKKNKWVGFVEAGITANILLGSKGLYSKWEAGVVEYIDLSNSNDAKAVFVQGNVGLGIKYQLKPNLLIHANYGFAGGITSMVESYRQVPRTNYVKIGFEYRMY